MPDILIRGMEMPESCADCHDADLPTAIAWLGAKCPWAHGIIDPGVYDLRHERHPNCPFYELPPHGDLIERDWLTDVAYSKVEYFGGAYVDTLDLAIAPVIVPASEEVADENP